MIILFQNILSSKAFLAYNGCFGLFINIKKWSGTSFWCKLPAWFLPYLILYQWAKFQCHNFFPSQVIKQNALFKFLFRQLMTSETLRFILDQALKQWLTRGKGGEDWNTKTWISWERKELFRWNKINIFHSFWRSIIWRKIKIC